MIDRVLTLPERWPGRTIALVGVLFALAYGSSLVWLAKPTGRIVIGDAVHYYVYLRSAVFDGDLRFRNEYVQLYGLRGGEQGTEWVYEPTRTGHTRNLMSVGPALAWAPLYLIVAALTWLLHAVGAGPPPDGYGRLFQATAGASGVVAAMLGAYAAYRAAALLVGVRAAIWATLAMWLGSSAIYYSLISPTYSHAISMLTVGVFLLVWLKTRARQMVGRYAMVGALGGVAALVRWQDAVLLIVPAIDVLWHAYAGRSPDALARDSARRSPHPNPLPGGERGSERGGLGHAAACLVACAAGALVAFAPQMLVWQALYGSPFLVPQGDEFMRWTSPSLLSVLFSDWHGLLTWTPIVAVALAGLVLIARSDRLVALALGAAFVAAWYTNAAAADWWAGEAYGARRFVSCFPIFVIGLAAAMQPLAHRLRFLAVVSTIVIVLNGLLLLQYQAFMHGLRAIVPYPKGAYELWLARFVVPFDLLRWWTQS
jgi:hypothetical protein